jgi:hypothetical protein
MLNFNFSGIDTETEGRLQTSFGYVVKGAINQFANRYGLSYEYPDASATPAEALGDFFDAAAATVVAPIYVVIDEYDHFANELLSFQTGLFKESVSKTGFVRKWYEVLKKYTATCIGRIFATGVSPITLDSLTSGFNIAPDISLDFRFNEMMGFTGAEVRDLVKATARFDITEGEVDGLMETLGMYYNGYLFSGKAKDRLFNSDMILYYLQTYAEAKDAPDNLIDSNIASDYAKLGRMFRLADDDVGKRVMESVLNGEEMPVELTRKFNMEREFTAEDMKSLLFYMGLLTVGEPTRSRTTLRAPNYVMKRLYYDYFLDSLQDAAKYRLDASAVQDAIEGIAKGGSNEGLVKLAEGLRAALSNRDLM